MLTIPVAAEFCDSRSTQNSVVSLALLPSLPCCATNAVQQLKESSYLPLLLASARALMRTYFTCEIEEPRRSVELLNVPSGLLLHKKQDNYGTQTASDRYKKQESCRNGEEYAAAWHDA